MLAVSSGDVVVGLVLGFLLGVVAGPLIRSWLVWREAQSASHEADLHASHEAELIADMLNRMEVGAWPPADETADLRGGRGANEKTPSGRWQPRP